MRDIDDYWQFLIIGLRVFTQPRLRRNLTKDPLDREFPRIFRILFHWVPPTPRLFLDGNAFVQRDIHSRQKIKVPDTDILEHCQG
jgi:hypothetical protein